MYIWLDFFTGTLQGCLSQRKDSVVVFVVVVNVGLRALPRNPFAVDVDYTFLPFRPRRLSFCVHHWISSHKPYKDVKVRRETPLLLTPHVVMICTFNRKQTLTSLLFLTLIYPIDSCAFFLWRLEYFLYIIADVVSTRILTVFSVFLINGSPAAVLKLSLLNCLHVFSY